MEMKKLEMNGEEVVVGDLLKVSNGPTVTKLVINFMKILAYFEW